MTRRKLGESLDPMPESGEYVGRNRAASLAEGAEGRAAARIATARPCSVCQRPMTVGQRYTHYVCDPVAFPTIARWTGSQPATSVGSTVTGRGSPTQPTPLPAD